MINSTIHKVSIIIPIYNEANTIELTLRKVVEADCYGFHKEIIIMNDCSTDSSKDSIYSYINSWNNTHSKVETCSIMYCENDKNLGKTQTIKKGILKSSGDIVIIQDGDLEYDPQDYSSLLMPFIEHGADVVYGSRFVGSEAKRILYFWHTVGNRLLTLVSNICSNLNLSDMETGYKVFRGDLIRTIAPHISSSRFGFEPEITARISKISEIHIYEVGIKYWGRTYQEGKKIRWQDGMLALLQIVWYNFFCKTIPYQKNTHDTSA